MQQKNAWFLVLVVALTGLSIWGYFARPYQLGLDIAGGIRLTYQMDVNELTADQRRNIRSIQSQVQQNLQRRAGSALGVVEATVQAKGEDQFFVELPGATDIEDARRVLGSTGKIQLFHAKTVSTIQRERRYSVAAQEVDEETGAPYATFTRIGGTSELKPGDPEYTRMIESWGEPILEGTDVTDARVDPLGQGMGRPSFSFGGKGAENLRNWSRRYIDDGENIAFVMDGRVLQISPKEDGAILDRGAYINGEFEMDYVQQLTGLIKSGSLPVELTELQYATISPTIGEKALGQIIIAGAISLAIILLYLILYYAFPGFVAAIAMILYVLFTLTVLKLIGTTFSLASIAGLILSAGMAVDANILVFERLKEEVKGGKMLFTAVDLGFKRALAAIFDSNACTLITSIILFMLGTTEVKGFATTLVIGVIISFFTAITVTRSLLVGLTSIGIGTDPKWYALNHNLFGEKLQKLHIIRHSGRFFAISGLFILPGLIAIGLGGIKQNVEFQGGYEVAIPLTGGVTQDQVHKNLEEAGFEGFNVKLARVGEIESVYVTIPPGNQVDYGDPQAKEKIAEAAGLSAEGSSINNVSPSISAETTNNAILGIVLATGFIILYISLRFGFALGGFKNGIKFGGSAVLAMLHDVVFIFGVAGILGLAIGWEISSLFITAMLTVIGFSVHDTIVIFDRIRENLRRSRGSETFEDICDKSVGQTFARSVNTSATAVVALIVLLFIGTPTPDLKFFVLVMLLGILIGTYSSIFNASPILYTWDRLVMKKHGEEEGLVAEAQRESKLRAAQVVAAPTADKVSSSDYGTIRRRQSVKDRAAQPVDEDEE